MALVDTQQEMKETLSKMELCCKDLSQFEGQLTRVLEDFQRLRKEIKKLEGQRKPVHVSKIQFKVNKLLDKIHILSDIIEDNYKLNRLEFIFKKIITVKSLKPALKILNSIQRPNFTSVYQQDNYKKYLPKLKQHYSTNNLDIKKLLFNRLSALYSTHRPSKNKNVPNKTCLQAQALTILRSINTRVNIVHSNTVCNFNKQAVYSQSKSLTIIYQASEEIMESLNLKFNTRFFTSILKHKIGLKKLTSIQNINNNLQRCWFNKFLATIENLQIDNRKITTQSRQIKIEKINQISRKLVILGKKKEAGIRIFLELKLLKTKKVIHKKGAPLYLLNSHLKICKSNTEYLEQIILKI